jgi:uncharacterized Zn finger protein
MAQERVEIECPRCGKRWDEDLAELDKVDQVVYKGVGDTQDYRVRCPQCGTVRVITVASGEEEGDG